MAAIHFDSQSVKKQAKLLEEAADQIQNQTVKVITAANEAVAASWSGKAAVPRRGSLPVSHKPIRRLPAPGYAVSP